MREQTHADHDAKVAQLRAVLERREPLPLSESAQRLDDALERTVKWDVRLSPGEREMWDRAAQARGVTTSEFVRDTVNHAAGEALAAAYATTE